MGEAQKSTGRSNGPDKFLFSLPLLLSVSALTSSLFGKGFLGGDLWLYKGVMRSIKRASSKVQEVLLITLGTATPQGKTCSGIRSLQCFQCCERQKPVQVHPEELQLQPRPVHSQTFLESHLRKKSPRQLCECLAVCVPSAQSCTEPALIYLIPLISCIRAAQ